jgi:hypothetical protein
MSASGRDGRAEEIQEAPSRLTGHLVLPLLSGGLVQGGHPIGLELPRFVRGHRAHVLGELQEDPQSNGEVCDDAGCASVMIGSVRGLAECRDIGAYATANLFVARRLPLKEASECFGVAPLSRVPLTGAETFPVNRPGREL